ncbi:MAG: peptidoglycan-binding protein [Betaproteobacteria bacterium HGW-Betaproteobacteria-22]|nr:MAG: peptidoglycan-binding protein [Betaproteobacteria bacterium HGW-Betaproteobacteria-22]
MNNVILSKKLLGALVLGMVLTACKSTPMTDKPAGIEDKSPSAAASQSTQSTDSSADTSGVKEVVIDSNATSGLSPLNDPNSILSKRNIYFDFDSDAVKAEFRPVIEAHAKYLLENGGAKVVLQGNADERGTREYNLSLGQRRAVSVKKSFNLLGVQDNQIETVSFGEEKATPNCDYENCHALNRRVDIVYGNE